MAHKFINFVTVLAEDSWLVNSQSYVASKNAKFFYLIIGISLIVTAVTVMISETTITYQETHRFPIIPEATKSHHQLLQFFTKTRKIVTTESTKKTLFHCDEIDHYLYKPSNDVYTTDLHGKPTAIYCEFGKEYNWLVIQRRISKKEDFNKDWKSYVQGFGEKNGNFWLGLDIVHTLTHDIPYLLRVDLTSWENETVYAEYSKFKIGNETTHYKLMVGNYNGTAGDSLSYHNNRSFSTFDRSNGDLQRCAEKYKGGWWFNKCVRSYLNGKYYANKSIFNNSQNHGILWLDWKTNESLRMVSMKIRHK